MKGKRLSVWKTLGTDPEFFCFNTVTNLFVALCDLIEGTKDKPKPMEVANCLQHIDNVSVEFNVPPATTLTELYNNVNLCLRSTEIYLQGINPAFTLVAQSSAFFEEEELCSDAAKTFGCEPSLTIYGTPFVPDAKAAGNMRSCGFHIHFGMDITEEQIPKFILLCDLFLGLPSVLADPDKERRKIYGKLGDYRVQKYGIEYRSLGIGMYHHKAKIEAGLERMKRAIEADTVDYLFDKMYTKVQQIHDKTGETTKGEINSLLNEAYL